MKHLGDITLIKGYEAPTVDCIIGGSPCQDLSLAGKRAGLAGARSGLYMEQIRIIKEMRENDRNHGRTGVDIRPRYMVWENVPGAFSTNQGQDFAAVLEEAIRVAEPEAPSVPVPEKGWPTSGCIVGECWSVAWRVLDAQFWGTSDKPLPQRRRRIALVADFGGLSASEILFVRKSLSGDLEPGKPKGKEATGDVGESSSGAEQSVISVDQGGGKSGATSYENISPTLTCTNDGAPAVAYSLEPGIAAREGGHIYDGVSGTLRAKAGDNQMAVAYSIENHPADSRVDIDESGMVQTLTSRMGTGGGNVPMVMELASFYPQMKAESQCFRQDGVSNTLVNGTNPGFQNAIVEARGYEMQSFGKYKDSGVQIKHIVRRLTPLECERLQGFPDGWTDIGEWVDSNGKKHKEADSPRYKALGNSIALPPWKWVLKRLCACYERDATMASLFDGIGGFPYIWEQLNGNGSCLWASEIEEFPIAVTKVRFGNDL